MVLVLTNLKQSDRSREAELCLNCNFILFKCTYININSNFHWLMHLYKNQYFEGLNFKSDL